MEAVRHILTIPKQRLANRDDHPCYPACESQIGDVRQQWRPCKLTASPLKEATDWLGEYRRFWEESFDRLEEYLDQLQEKETEND